MFYAFDVNTLTTLAMQPITERHTESWGVAGFLGSLKISLSEERRLKDTQNLKCEDGRLQKLPRFEG